MTRYLPHQQYLTEAAGTLFKIAFRQDDDQGLIRYFELLREKLPSFNLSFMETARVAAAYRNTGEHEQALQLCAMIAGASFNRESKVAEALEKQGEFDGAVEYMKSLILTYPDLPIAQTALFALGQRVLDLAGPAGGKPRIPKRSRSDIIAQGIKLVKEFLITYPMNPVADEAAYTLISTLLDREQSARVAELCPIFLKRWPESKLKSSMEYAEAFALFETGNYDEARGMLTRVADREDRGLTPAERDDRDLARYILGQIEHAGGRIAEALERYKQVMKKFEDAKEASDFFNRKEVSLPEVSTFQTGTPVKLILKYCNMKQVKLSAYKVDLMKLYLARKTLKNITDINLAGIAPVVAMDIFLGEGRDYKEMKKRIDLPLEEKGAYLLVVQGDESGCSGMVLVSDLTLDVQEEAASGRVRVNVKDALSGSFQKNVYMKVIGSGNEAFSSGYTDLRGIYVADDIAGTSTVIADRDGEYAFHRGKVVLQPSAAMQMGQELKLDKKRKAPQRGARNRALQNIFQNQMEIQQKGQQMMNDIYEQADEGVQIK
jgi:tetratricopeptide (TPR) repeat protein